MVNYAIPAIMQMTGHSLSLYHDIAPLTLSPTLGTPPPGIVESNGNAEEVIYSKFSWVFGELQKAMWQADT